MSNGNDALVNSKHWLMGRLSRERCAALRRHLSERLGFLFRCHLPWLAMIYGTDKWGIHWYAAHYARHFGHLRRKKITLLEIGVGGYENPQDGGGSLRMWPARGKTHPYLPR